MISTQQDPDEEEKEREDNVLAHFDKMNQHGHFSDRVEAIGHAPGASVHRVAREELQRIAKSNRRIGSFETRTWMRKKRCQNEKALICTLFNKKKKEYK
jgi:hypothetical protein